MSPLDTASCRHPLRRPRGERVAGKSGPIRTFYLQSNPKASHTANKSVTPKVENWPSLPRAEWRGFSRNLPRRLDDVTRATRSRQRRSAPRPPPPPHPVLRASEARAGELAFCWLFSFEISTLVALDFGQSLRGLWSWPCCSRTPSYLPRSYERETLIRSNWVLVHDVTG